jgi:hypothetical protein
MKRDDGWSLLGIFKAGSLTVFSILFITLMGGALLPIVGNFVADMLLWLTTSVALAAVYVRAAYVYRRRMAAHTGGTVDALATLSEVAYEVLALLGGGFFGVLCASLAWDEYHKAGEFAGHAPLMTGIAAIGLGACIASLVKLGRYMRTDT